MPFYRVMKIEALEIATMVWTMTKEVKQTAMTLIAMQIQKFGRAMTRVVQRPTEITTLLVGNPEVDR